MSLKKITITIIAVASVAISYPIVKNNNCCQLAKNNTAVKYCAVKPDSLRESEIQFVANKLKKGPAYGVINPEKNSLKYRMAKPEKVDPFMVAKPQSDLQMR